MYLHFICGVVYNNEFENEKKNQACIQLKRIDRSFACERKNYTFTVIIVLIIGMFLAHNIESFDHYFYQNIAHKKLTREAVIILKAYKSMSKIEIECV